MSANYYFDFLGTVWQNLPKVDKDRLGEAWRGYEQVVAASYQEYAEAALNIALSDILPYDTERWLPYAFDSNNFVTEAASFRSYQDISQDVYLVNKYLLKLSVNDGVPFEVDIRGVDPAATTIQEIVSLINAAAGFTFASAIIEDSILVLTSNMVGVTSAVTVHPTSDPAKNACEIVLGLLAINLPQRFPEYPWPYRLPYPKIASIPEFNAKIRDADAVLVETTDYAVVTPDTIRFKVQPPAAVWAKRTLFDTETPWNNFGFLMDIYQKNSSQYITVLQGLWFAFWNGPKPSNLRTALYLLFSLPVAPANGTIKAVTLTQITFQYPDGTLKIIDIPINLVSLVAPGQAVTKFEPLVDGIDIFDKINKPGFVETELGRAGIAQFLTENATLGTDPDTDESKALRTLEEHTFLPQISVNAFSNPDISLANVRIFLEAIKPLSKTFFFQVIVGVFLDPIALQDRISLGVDIDITPNLDSNQTTFAEMTTLDNYETIDNEALNLDSDGILFQESVKVEVYSFGILQEEFYP